MSKVKGISTVDDKIKELNLNKFMIYYAQAYDINGYFHQ